MHYVTVVPAYGRDYKTKAEVMGDWHANNDFEIASDFDRRAFGGRYINSVDLARWNSDPNKNEVIVHIRYRRLERIVEVRK